MTWPRHSSHVTRPKSVPLEKASNLAWWIANVTGKDSDFAAKEEAQNRLDAALADRDRFAQLKAIKESPVSDPLLARQIDVLYLLYLEKQVDPELLKKITAKANAIEKAFNVYRAKVDGKEMTDSEVRKVLKESQDSRRAQGRLGGEQGRRPARRGRPEGTGQAAQRGGRAAGLPELPRHAAPSQRADPGAGPQAVRRARRADPRAVPQGSRPRSTPGSPKSTASRSRTCAPGTITTRSSRSRRPSSPPTSTRSTPRPTSSSSAAISTPASACRSTT